MRAFSSRKPVDCPAAPPARRTTQARTLHTACLIVGGAPQLAAQLGVPVALLRDWLEGESEPPPAAFLAAVEMILLHLDARGSSA